MIIAVLLVVGKSISQERRNPLFAEGCDYVRQDSNPGTDGLEMSLSFGLVSNTSRFKQNKGFSYEARGWRPFGGTWYRFSELSPLRSL